LIAFTQPELPPRNSFGPAWGLGSRVALLPPKILIADGSNRYSPKCSSVLEKYWRNSNTCALAKGSEESSLRVRVLPGAPSLRSVHRPFPRSNAGCWDVGIAAGGHRLWGTENIQSGVMGGQAVGQAQGRGQRCDRTLSTAVQLRLPLRRLGSVTLAGLRLVPSHIHRHQRLEGLLVLLSLRR
jgi:hypothetical protein